MRSIGLGYLSLALLLACSDEEPFIPLEDLCDQLAVDVCEARGGCCPSDPASCLMAEKQRCESVIDSYEKEPTLEYDSARADTQRSAARATLNTCGPLPVLAVFFEGGAPLATPCERASQCASGSCLGEPRVCVEAVVVQLCPAP